MPILALTPSIPVLYKTEIILTHCTKFHFTKYQETNSLTGKCWSASVT